MNTHRLVLNVSDSVYERLQILAQIGHRSVAKTALFELEKGLGLAETRPISELLAERRKASEPPVVHYDADGNVKKGVTATRRVPGQG